MPRQQRAVDTRRSALLGAATVIERDGFEAASIAEIVRESGLSKGALYFHFPSKESIADAIIAEQGEWITRHAAPETPPVQALVDLCYTFVAALRSDPLLRASIRMTVDRAAPPEVVEAGYRMGITGVQARLDEARDAGTLLPRLRTEGCAYTITSAMTGLQLTSEALTGRRDLPDRVEDFWRLFVPAIVRPELVDRVDVRPPERRRNPVTAPV